MGGILANDSYPAEFLYDNLMIQTNIAEAAYRSGVEKLMLLGSSCIYPRLALQPITENALLTGPLEPTNEWYAIAKIAGIKLGQAYRRQYGFRRDQRHAHQPVRPRRQLSTWTPSHVLPALVRKAHEAKIAGALELHHLGHGRATAGVPPRRRLRRRLRPPHEGL